MAKVHIDYLTKQGLRTAFGLIKKSITGTYTVKGRAIFADTSFLALSSNEKNAIAAGASSINSAGIWQYVTNTWTKITAFEEGYVYDIMNAFTTTSDFLEGADHKIDKGTNIVAVNTGTTATPVLKWDLFSGVLDLSNYQTKRLVAPLTVFENETPTEYATAADLPASEPKSTATITNLMVAILSNGDVYRASVAEGSTTNTITWVKLGDQQTVEGALQLLANVTPNTPITDEEITDLWVNA